MNPHEVRGQLTNLNERLDRIEESAKVRYDEMMKAHRANHELLSFIKRKLRC